MKLNKPLVIGLIILSLLLVIVLIPGLLTNKDPYSIQTLKYTIEDKDGESVFLSAPFAPSDRNVWGTDELGRDIFSFIIYGTRLTLKIALLVTLFRFALAIPLGIFSAFNYSVPKNIIRQVNILFSGLPPLLFAVFVLYLNVFTRLDKTLSTIAFVTVLTLVGFGKLAGALEETTKTVLNKPFITSEYLLGKSKYEVAIENVLPHIMPEIVVLFFMEIARVLSLQIQLGLFSIFVGNLKILLGDDNGIIRYWNVSFEPDWASLLGYATVRIRTSPWMALFPAGAFFISVLGFNMLGEGLRIKLQNDQTKFVPKVRKMISYIFLKKHRHHHVSMKYIIGAIIICVFAFNLMLFNNNQDTLGDKSYLTEDSLPNRLYIGMNEIEDVTDQLANEMRKIGLEPIYEGYKQSYDVEASYYVENSMFMINEETYKQELDYVISSFADIKKETVTILDARNISLYNKEHYNDFKDKAIWVDGKHYTSDAIEEFTKTLAKAGCKAIIVSNHNKKISIGSFVGPIPIVIIKDHVSIQAGDKMTFESHVVLLGNKGTNVVGRLEGKDQNTSNEIILISVPLNYNNKEHALKTFNYSLEMAEKLKDDSNRSIVLIFIDGTYNNKNNGILAFSDVMVFDPYMHIEYFYLRSVDYGEGTVVINKDQSPDNKYFGVSFFQSLEKTSLDYKFIRESAPDQILDMLKHPDFVMHHKKGIDTIIIDVYSEADTFYESFYKALEENN